MDQASLTGDIAMNTSGIRMLGLGLALLVGHSLAGVAHAQEAGALKITNAVFQEVEVKAADGKVTRKLVPATKVVPGGEVVYEINYDNTGKAPATDVAITNPVPPQLTFVDVEGTPVTSVSVDGGRTYGTLTALTVTGSDGQQRAAQPADVNHLRWVLAALQPGSKGKVSFRARVK